MRVLGIDPGADGALAVYSSPVRGSPKAGVPPMGATLSAWDMPFNEVTVGATKRKRLDIAGLAELLDDILVIGVDRVVVEEVSAMPKNSGMFAFGFGVGVVHTLLRERKVAFDLVTPAKWKREVKAPKDKAEAVVRAEEIWPEHRDVFRDTSKTARGKTRPDRAEAALIAYWGATCK